MWLKDTNGAIYRIDALTAVTPLEFKDDKRDQTKITRVCAQLFTAGGNTHHTNLDFAEVVRQVAPSASPPTIDPPKS